jgi:hypothetical protein
MKRWKILIIVVILIISVFLLRLKPKLLPHPPGKFFFMDNYEDNPIITKTTHELWMKIIRDTKKGNYWTDQHWLEIAKQNKKGQYRIAPTLGEATLTDEVAHEGKKSVEITVSEVPEEYIYYTSLLARYSAINH